MFRRGVVGLVASLALVPVAVAWDSSPVASASQASSSTIEGSSQIQCDNLDTNVMVMASGTATCKVTSDFRRQARPRRRKRRTRVTTTSPPASVASPRPIPTTTAPSSWACTSSVPNYLDNNTTTVVSSVTQGTASKGAIVVVTSGGPNPGTFSVGQPVADATTPNAIPSGATVASVNGSTLTLSNGVTSIGSGDVLNQGGYEYWSDGGCPVYPTTWVDTTDFTGQSATEVGGSNGGSTASPGQDVWGAICTDASGNLVDVNDPTCVNRGDAGASRPTTHRTMCSRTTLPPIPVEV